MTLLFTDARFLDHDTGAHVETAERLISIQKRLQAAGLIEKCRRPAFKALSERDVEAVHDPGVAAAIVELGERGGGRLDPDTVVSPRSPGVALLAAGAACAAVDAVVAGTDRSALCLIRPPGHHATPDHSMGFCPYNNIALAARHAVDAHGLSRILIVDWDVHHGNGTQDIFYMDPRVMFLSIHRYGYGFYPGTGAANETGVGPGLGFTRNVPVPFGTARGVYFDKFTQALEECVDLIKPQLVLVSAGFDAHALDPIGSLGLDTDDFGRLTEQVLQIAETHSAGRLVSCLEGGYNLDALAESVQVHLEQLLAFQK
jgi:acetoin utilization deacetylase AcuC-like enzyme